MNKLFVGILALGALFVGYKQGCRTTSSEYMELLMHEQSAHAATQKALEVAVAKGLGWEDAYVNMKETAHAYQKSAAVCLAREHDWQMALEQQETLFYTVSNRKPTQEELAVVDIATRQKVATALNAAW